MLLIFQYTFHVHVTVIPSIKLNEQNKKILYKTIGKDTKASAKSIFLVKITNNYRIDRKSTHLLKKNNSKLKIIKKQKVYSMANNPEVGKE